MHDEIVYSKHEVDTMPKTKLVAIKNGRGEITGHITLYWSPALQTYVSIPAKEDEE